MAGRLAGKRAVVTGAAAGIGEGITRRFLEEGATVLAADLDPSAVAPAGPGVPGRLEAARLDVTDRPGIAALAERIDREWGGVDVLVCNAGGTLTQYPPVLDADEDYWDRMFVLNARSVFDTCRAFVPLMRDGGSVVTIASAGVVVHKTGFGVYGAAKAAVARMTQAIAGDYASRGVRANAICPGTIATAAIQRMLATAPDREERERVQLAGIPLGRFGTPRDVGNLALFLASDESSYLTGTVQVLDGGATLG
ncbi:2-keto-3-deoxy-L-fuconate dehydrogenase [Lentzea fradiae]|uniref:2-keto-3-deoxy-L-fuconate dehydrogenase n=1 Tax=Lentzea fradiae TaxID=200378 RepID=A0A1G7R5W1_9PSEU|nr:SDR family oxidoreductase [Lentzea fradiae]SDG05360.1 2-keto-3-deoxy-L-fuconate dehydrogenase [Lentzea fradiae]